MDADRNRPWLIMIALLIVVIGLLGIVGYGDLRNRLNEIEQRLAPPPRVAAPTNATDPEPEPEDPTIRQVAVYFVRISDQEAQLMPVARQVPVATPARAALEELLRGPTSEEAAAGLGTEIPQGTQLRDILVTEGVARVSFSSELDRDVAGSARVIAIRRQIEETLFQFDQVQEVVIEVNGRVDDVLQP
jgi:germination protein M